MHSYLYKYLGMLHTDTILLYKQGGLAKMQITHYNFAHICRHICTKYIGIPVVFKFQTQATLDVIF